MEYLSFRIENFKGILNQEIRLDKPPTGRVFTLVGLNESGKTTVLEAISLLESREKHLESLYQEEFRHGDVHDWIPIKKKANFNESIKISAEISMSASDIGEIISYVYNNFAFKIDRKKFPGILTITKEMKFKDSIYIGTTNWWGLPLIGKPNKQRKNINLSTYDKQSWNTVITEINKMMPSILYFPTFLFDFPEYVYVSEETDESEKNAYYRSVIKDILDSLSDENNKYNIDQHIVSRARSDSRPAIRALDALLNKMGIAVSQTVFEMWNNIFERNIPRKDLVISYDTEDAADEGAAKVCLEFSIKDGDEIYLITERSLGFRWFFCFVLFTHFRQYRKEQKEFLFLFDEPASNLHLRAQTQLLRSFTKMIKEGHGKIIYSTHSHYMINPKWLENTYIVSNKGIYDTDGSIYEYSSRDTDIQIVRYREFASIHPDKENYFQPILNALEYAPSRLEFVPDSIFVEGKNDFYMIKYFEDVILKTEKSLSIIPGTGSGGLETLISLYMGWGKKFIILLDDDREGRECRERYIQEWHLSESQVFTLGDIRAEWKNFEIENLFSAISIDNIRNKAHPYNKNNRLSKKELARILQEKLINEDRSNISDETTSTFSKLIAALKDKLRR